MSKRLWGGVITLILLIPVSAEAAILSLLPERTVVQVGEVIRLPVVIETEGEEINAIEARVKIPTGLAVMGIETGNSVLTLWVENPDFDPTTREVKFVGGTPAGFRGQALLATLLVKIEKSEDLEISFEEKSQVLLNDGQGTAAKLIREGTRFEAIEISAPKISSRTHPDETHWYSARDLEVSLEKKESAAYSLVLDDWPETIPDIVPEEVKETESFPGLPDGIHYLHFREREKDVWGAARHFRIQVDGTSPEALELKEDDEYLSWSATDKHSGLDYFELVFAPRPFNSWFGRRKESPQKISRLARFLGGVYTVTAADQAGNERRASLPIKGRPAAPIILTSVLILIILFIVFILWRFRQSSISHHL